MRVLVGCEESGVVRRAFAAQGHNAWSCDLQPARDGSPNHYQFDVFDAIQNHGPWDLIILHPPCTALCVSGNRTYGKGQPKYADRTAAIQWTHSLWNIAKRHAPKVALENPVGVVWPFLNAFKKPQYIQPHMFGHMEQKKTGLLLHNLPELVPTNDVKAAMLKLPKKQIQRIHYVSPGPLRARIRSETYQGIADAMAQQWK